MDQRMPLTSSSPLFNHGSSLITLLLVLLSSLLLLNVLNPFQPLSVLRFAFPYNSSHSSSSAAVDGCDYSNGRWVWDEDRNAGSYSERCPFLDPGFQCVRSGRNDTGYQNWRWQPNHCTLPRFNASDMLERSRNKRIAFVGDSIGRNQWESFLCMLSTAVENKSSIYEVYGNPISKHKGFLFIRFGDYNLTVEYYRTPYLVVVGRPPPGSPRGIRKSIRVDTPHWQSKRWKGADVLVLNTGHWWNEDKTFKQGAYFQAGASLNMTMDVKAALEASLDAIRDWVLRNMKLDKSFVFFRGFSPTHFRNGTWDTGGVCSLWTGPETDQHRVKPDPWYNMVISKIVKEMEEGEGVRHAHFLNITYLTELRRDGHPSAYREPGVPRNSPQDCSHWCLPGVPDTWNELVYAHLLSNGYGHRARI